MSELTKAEQTNVRTAIRHLRLTIGPWETIAPALKIEADSLARIAGGSKEVSASIAFRIARFANCSIDGLLSGDYPGKGTCPNCGYLAGDHGLDEPQKG